MVLYPPLVSVSARVRKDRRRAILRRWKKEVLTTEELSEGKDRDESNKTPRLRTNEEVLT